MTTTPKPSAERDYKPWHEKVIQLAKDKGFDWLINGTTDDFTLEDAFEDGLTPEEALEEEINEARSNL